MPTSTIGYYLLGYSHHLLDYLDKAFGYYQKALKLDPEHRGANKYIGELTKSSKKRSAGFDASKNVQEPAEDPPTARQLLSMRDSSLLPHVLSSS